MVQDGALAAAAAVDPRPGHVHLPRERLRPHRGRHVADHIEPHGGDWDKFWSGPFQTLCKACHDGAKQRIERAGKKAAFYPEWLPPSKAPLTIVCGAPASGKSRYVAGHLAAGDLVIDLDVIASSLAGSAAHSWDRERWLHPALFKRNDLLGRLSGKPRCAAAWFVVAEPRAERRQWWVDKLAPQAVLVIETTMEQCLANAARDADRDQAATAAALARWWSNYGYRPGDVRLAQHDPRGWVQNVLAFPPRPAPPAIQRFFFREFKIPRAIVRRKR